MRVSTWRHRVHVVAIAGLAAALAGCPKEKAGAVYVPASYSISGTVTGDVQGGVTVKLLGTSRSTTTLQDGTYTIAGLSNGTYTVEASRSGYAFFPGTRTARVNGANVTAQDFTARLGIAIAGKVLGPVTGGVTVTLTGPSPATTTTTATTDADGDYAFVGVVAGTYTVTPSLAGGWTFTPANSLVTIASASVTGPNFASIAPGRSVSGKITGARIAGVTVSVSGGAVAVTDATGSYSFTGLADLATYTLTPSYPGLAFTPATRNAVLSGADVTVPDFVAVAVHRISGRVTGAALEGVTVALSGAATGSATTDATGYFEFPNLVDGTYDLTPTMGGLTFSPATSSVTLAGADVTAPNFAATPTSTYGVSGTVSGGVVGGVSLTLAGATSFTTTAGPTGTFAFGGVAPGDYMLIPANEDYTFDPASRVVQVLASNLTAQNFTATLKATARTITGTVSGAVGAGVTVSLTGIAPAAPTVTATTDGAGRFAFRGLADGQYSVTPTIAGVAFVPANCLVTVSGPSVTEVDFVGTVSISGKVTGAVTAGVTVTLSVGSADAVAVTAPDGSYSFSGLANGDYKVTPSLLGYAFSPVEAAVTVSGTDTTGVDFLAMKTHRISGYVTGDVVEGVKVALSGAAAGDATTSVTGYFEFLDLVDGTYFVTPSAEGYTFDPQSRAIALAADVTDANFVATVIPTYTVSGTISGATGLDVKVSLSGTAALSVVTNTGTYTFTGLANGSYMVIPSLPGYTFTPASRAFHVNGANVTGQDFTAQ